MTSDWSPAELVELGGAEELQIAAARSDGTMLRAVPIWVVRVGEDVFVRTWQRRTNGWFGHAVASGRAHVHVPNVDADVVVEDIGDDPATRAAIDAAYRAKYARYGEATTGRMVSDEAAAATLRLVRLT